MPLLRAVTAKELIVFSPLEGPEHARYMEYSYTLIPDDQRELQKHRWFVTPEKLGFKNKLTLHNFHTHNFHTFFGAWYSDPEIENNFSKYLIESVGPTLDTNDSAGDGYFNPAYITMSTEVGHVGSARIEAVQRYGGNFYRPQLRIDKGVVIGFVNHIGCADRLHIQKDVQFAARNTVTDHDHTMDADYKYPVWSQPLACAPVSIGRGSLFGDGAVVLKGVNIGHHSVIGANAVVTKNVPPYSTVVGVPGKVIRVRPPTKGLVSIIIPTYNTRELTQQCIEFVYQHTPDPYEIILVDNGSRDDTVEFMHMTNMCDKIVTLPTNKGFAGGINAGLKEATGEYICLLNSDVVVTEGWLEPLLRAFNFDSYVGITAPLWNVIKGEQTPPSEILDAEGNVQFDADGICGRLAKLYPTQMRVCATIPAVCWIMRKSDMDKIGPFDERFGLGNFEDDDYCRRMVDTTGGIILVPYASFVYHLGGKTFQTAKIDYNAQMTKNKAIYIEKWGEEPTAWIDRNSNILRERFNGN
jgi:GT2 family glycosyltransferase/acetyltransferase-like isoleucine patch superfamily enzyme